MIRKILKSKRGEGYMDVAIGILCLMLVIAFAVTLLPVFTTVTTTNYDETYNGTWEGYSGGYLLSGDNLQENLDFDDVYYRLDYLLGTDSQDGYHIKRMGIGYEYRLSGLDVEITNSPLTPGNANRNFEADARITIEIPLSFGWEVVPPLKMEVRTRAAYMPKF